MATTDSNGFITIENSDLFNISHANGNAAAASAVANRVTTAEGNISDIQTALGNKVDTSTYTAGMATKVNSSTYTAGMATKVDKVDGKGLSTEDYTTAEKNKLAGIETGANAYSLPTASTSDLGGVKVGSDFNIYAGVLNVKSATSTDFVSSVVLDGTTLSSSEYTVEQAQRTYGKPFCFRRWLRFRFNDSRTISAGSKLVILYKGLLGISLTAGAALGYNEAYNADHFVCGSFLAANSSVTVNIAADTIGVFFSYIDLA